VVAGEQDHAFVALGGRDQGRGKGVFSCGFPVLVVSNSASAAAYVASESRV